MLFDSAIPAITPRENVMLKFRRTLLLALARCFLALSLASALAVIEGSLPMSIREPLFWTAIYSALGHIICRGVAFSDWDEIQFRRHLKLYDPRHRHNWWDLELWAATS